MNPASSLQPPASSLIPHPAFSPASPVITARELLLAAACAGLKEQLIQQAVHIAAVEEDNRALRLRNAELTKALHRTACAGACLPDVLAGVALLGIGAVVALTLGGQAWGCYLLGCIAGIAWLAFVALRAARRAGRTTPRHRVHPAHINEPAEDARIIDAIRRAPEPRGYPADLVIDEAGHLHVGALYNPEDLHRPMVEHATRHAEAETEREAFFATAARLNLERGRFEAADPASL